MWFLLLAYCFLPCARVVRASAVGSVDRVRAILRCYHQKRAHTHHCRLMELASAVILFPLPEANGDAVHLLAQTPAAVLDLSLMHAAVAAWTWIMAEGSARIKVAALLLSFGSAWHTHMHVCW